MIRLGFFSFISSALQLVVPTYGLRLVRRFGTNNVGWFLVLAFASLAFVHLLEPLKAVGAGPTLGVAPDLLCAIASGLLLVGMGHIDTLFSERRQSKEEEEKLQGTWALRVKEQSSSKEELLQDILRYETRVKALQESEAQYRFLFMENPQPMWIVDLRSFQFLAVNRAALRQYGFALQEFMALKPGDLLPAESAAAFLQNIARPCSGSKPGSLWRHYKKDRTLIDVEITAVDLKYRESPARLVLANDISQRRRHELELLETQKMETIGQLAGGAALHFNNLLTVIDGYANLMLHKPQDPQTTEQLKQICAAANRAAGLTRQLLGAGGRHLLHKEVLDLNELIRNRGQMLRRLVGESITLQNALYSNLPPVLADPHLVEHVIVNLVLNARDAMPGGGTLTISTAGLRIVEADARIQHKVEASEFACLSIQDTGCGMTAQIQAHVFEPFFTTRDFGKGTGLGLASVYGAVKQHGGWVEFTSEVGAGTEFRVFIPSAPASAIAAQKQSPPAAPPVRETILLVEPNDRLRGLARFVLDRYGYRVVEADSAPTALLLWEGESVNVDLLLTDLRLPGDLSGRALAERLRTTKAGLKVVYTSDCGPEAEGQVPVLLEGLQFIPKPYNPDKLLQTVQVCLAKNK